MVATAAVWVLMQFKSPKTPCCRGGLSDKNLNITIPTYRVELGTQSVLGANDLLMHIPGKNLIEAHMTVLYA